jgi:hypothetical protein
VVEMIVVVAQNCSDHRKKHRECVLMLITILC